MPGAVRPRGRPGRNARASRRSSVTPFNPLASPQPKFQGDATLRAEFPEKIGGQAVQNAETVPMLAFVCYLAGQDSVDELRQAFTLLGWDIGALSAGSFDASFGEDTVNV